MRCRWSWVAAEESGQRSVSIFSRADADSGWVCHAEGTLSSGSVEPNARPVGVAAGGCGRGGRGRRLRAVGGARVRVRSGVPGIDRDVGPRRRGVRRGAAAGRGRRRRRIRGAPGVAGCGVARRGHAHQAADEAEVVLPFSWQGVSLHAAGASAVRARIAPAGPSAVSIELADGLGLPVLSVAAMVARPVSEQQLRAAVSGSGPDRLFEVVWSPATGEPPVPSRLHPHQLLRIRCSRRRSGDGNLSSARTRRWLPCSRG